MIEWIDQFVVGADGDGESAMGRERFEGERSGGADFGFVFVRFVVEVFKVGFGGDRSVYFLLPFDT